jgi:hypothetical protein
MTIRHSKVSAVPDDANADLVRPSDWNDDHVIADGYTFLRKATVTLTDEQIRMLPTTPVEILPAPGVGKAIFPIRGLGVMRWGTPDAAYTNISATDGYIFLKVGTLQSGGVVTDGTITAMQDFLGSDLQENFVDFPATSVYESTVYGPVSGMHGALPALEDQPLMIEGWNDLGPFEDGHADNTLTVTVYYVVVDL